SRKPSGPPSSGIVKRADRPVGSSSLTGGPSTWTQRIRRPSPFDPAALNVTVWPGTGDPSTPATATGAAPSDTDVGRVDSCSSRSTRGGSFAGATSLGRPRSVPPAPPTPSERPVESLGFGTAVVRRADPSASPATSARTPTPRKRLRIGHVTSSPSLGTAVVDRVVRDTLLIGPGNVGLESFPGLTLPSGRVGRSPRS